MSAQRRATVHDLKVQGAFVIIPRSLMLRTTCKGAWLAASLIVRGHNRNGPENQMRRAYLETSSSEYVAATRLVKDTLVVEKLLRIQLVYGPADARATKSISATTRTPGYNFELAAGFLMTEGVIRMPPTSNSLATRPKALGRPIRGEETVLPNQTERNRKSPMKTLDCSDHGEHPVAIEQTVPNGHKA
jgi:hypothetical protein